MKNVPRRSGFTLIETLVAISILTIAVAGPLVAANQALMSSQLAGNELTASYLAQEGVEYVRELRDNAYLGDYHAGSANLSATAWSDFLTAAAACRNNVTPSQKCLVDPLLQVRTACTGSGCLVPLNLASGRYTTQSGTASPFTRTVVISDVSATEELVTSVVSWSLHGTTYSVSVNDHLTSWQ